MLNISFCLFTTVEAIEVCEFTCTRPFQLRIYIPYPTFKKAGAYASAFLKIKITIRPSNQRLNNLSIKDGNLVEL